MKAKDKKTPKNDIFWSGYKPSANPEPIPQFERKYDFPYGTTRSGSKPGYVTAGKRCYQKPHTFFKPKELRDFTTEREGVVGLVFHGDSSSRMNLVEPEKPIFRLDF